MPHRLHDYLGGKIFLDLDESPMMRARIEGTYEPFKTRMLQSLLAPEMIYVDIGTNKGYFALLAARLLNGTGQVLGGVALTFDRVPLALPVRSLP